jgi:hypothetical protein
VSLAAFIVIVVGSPARSSCCGHIYIYIYIYIKRERESVRVCVCVRIGSVVAIRQPIREIKISNLAACRLFACGFAAE